jgi:hypothetical protein
VFKGLEKEAAELLGILLYAGFMPSPAKGLDKGLGGCRFFRMVEAVEEFLKSGWELVFVLDFGLIDKVP